MNQYEHSLVAMKRLLDRVGEARWADWIEADLREWRESRGTAHHLSAYGGMGSFNDVWISRGNGNAVTAAQEPWANELFAWLKALCRFLAQRPEASFDAAALEKAVGEGDPALSALVGGEKAPASSRGLSGGDRRLEGWRCLRCGHAEATEGAVESLIAADVIPTLVFAAVEGATLDRVVDRALAGELGGGQGLRRSLAAAAAASGIVIREGENWMSPCPECGEDDTGLYRWRLVDRDGLRFEAAEDNLKLRVSALFRRLFRREPLV